MSDGLPMGLVGFGGRGETVAASLDAAPGVDFRAVADLREDRLAVAADAHDVDTYSDANAMFERDDIAAVMVATRADVHARVSIAAMEAGNHVLCEKPLAETVADAREMVAAAARTGQRSAVHFQSRYDPFYWTLSDLAADLDPLQMLLTYQRGIFAEHHLRPGYAFGVLDGAIHEIDLANWIVGRTPTAVSATLNYGTYSPEEAIDAATVQIEYTDGEVATVQSSMGGAGIENACHLVGEHGNAQRTGPDALRVTDVAYEGGDQRTDSRTVEFRHPPGFQRDPSPEASGRGVALKEAFVGHVRGEDTGIATFADGLEALLVAKAAVVSEETGRTIHLTDIREERPTV